MPDPANDNRDHKDDGTKPCVVCGKPQTAKYKPFCSKRCADVDLARWLGGSYAIPVKHDDEDEDGLPSPMSDER